MNPKEFPWTEDQQVTVTNPTPESYKFKVHNKEYELGAGKTGRMPGYIAWVYVYGMASKLCQEDKFFMRWNEEGFRQEYYDKVVSGVDPVMQAVEVEEQSLVETLDDEEVENPAEDLDTSGVDDTTAQTTGNVQAKPNEPTEEELIALDASAPKSPGITPMKPKAKAHEQSASRN